MNSTGSSFPTLEFCVSFHLIGLARGQRVHARMSGSRYGYRVPTAYNNVGFDANDLVDYSDYDGSLSRSLSGFSDDTASLGSPTTYPVSPGLDGSFGYNFDSSYYSHRQAPIPRSTTTTSSGPYTAHWTDTPSPRYKNTYNFQPAVTGSVNVQPSR